MSDPDAFSVSTQTIIRHWHGGERPLTLDEAQVSIALAAVSGGMFEIGDDLPTRGADAQRLALVKNRDLLDLGRLGCASTPVDLLDYLPEDKQPSIFSAARRCPSKHPHGFQLDRETPNAHAAIGLTGTSRT